MANDAGPVALFAGATAGLGEAILKAYAGKHTNARIYFVGRNEVAAQQIIRDVRQLWKDAPKNSEGEGDIIFLKADLSLLRNVRGVAEEFMRREGDNARLDFLCMSQGYLTLRGRIETSEHYDAPFVLHLYSRIYLAYLLTASLRRSTAPHGGRVVSVHAPGQEGPLHFDDLDLKERHPSWFDWLFPSWLRALTGLDPSYMISSRVGSSSAMMTLFFEELARRERERPEMQDDGVSEQRPSFLHVFPELVKTKEFERGDFPFFVKFLLTKVLLPLVTPFTNKAEKVGEGIASMAEDPKFGCVVSSEAGKAEGMVAGSDGIVGSGSYALNWDGKRLIKDRTMEALRKKGASEKVWNHCVDIFNNVPNA